MKTCAICSAENDTLRCFCLQCGATLGSPCCGFTNESQAHFCGGCGRPLARAAEDALGDPSEQVVDLSWAEIQGQAAAARQRREQDGGLQHLDQAELDALFED